MQDAQVDLAYHDIIFRMNQTNDSKWFKIIVWLFFDILLINNDFYTRIQVSNTSCCSCCSLLKCKICQKLQNLMYRLLTFCPTFASLRKNCAPKSYSVTVSWSNRVILATPAKARFLQTSSLNERRPAIRILALPILSFPLFSIVLFSQIMNTGLPLLSINTPQTNLTIINGSFVCLNGSQWKRNTQIFNKQAKWQNTFRDFGSHLYSDESKSWSK